MKQQPQKFFSRPLSIFFISLLKSLERLAYYSITSILIIYAVSEEGWSLERNLARDYYSWFIILVAVLPFFMGLLTDFFLKQKKAILIGAFTALFGSLFLLGNVFVFNIIGLILILFGIALIGPNLWVLLGRLYEKREQSRILGFLFALLFINLGGFFGPAIVGYLREHEMGWSSVFGVVSIAMTLFIMIFLIVKGRLDIREKNLEPDIYEGSTEHSVLDSEMTGLRRHYNSFLVILTIISISALFWSYDGAIMNYISDLLAEKEGFLLFGYENPDLVFPILAILASLVFGVVLFFVWYKKKTGNSFWRIITAIGFLGAAAFLTNYLNSVPDDNLTEFLVLMAIVISMADIFISPVVICYITRLSDVRYSSSMVGFYILIPFIIGKLVDYLKGGIDFDWMVGGPIVIAFIFVILVIFRRQLEKLANGIV
jgi:POT family proton-dependent oligopeptide transporter